MWNSELNRTIEIVKSITIDSDVFHAGEILRQNKNKIFMYYIFYDVESK